MLVGKISNFEGCHQGNAVVAGAEKGYFEYGGSTIILLIPKNAAIINDDILKASESGVETEVKLGECCGTSGS